MITPGGISPFWIPRVYYSDTVEQVLDGFPQPLSPTEPGKIAQIINLMVSSGNWTNRISFALFALEDEENKLWDWIRQSAMIAEGSPTSDLFGFIFNGTDEYIRTTVIPSTSGLLQDDMMQSIYCYENLSIIQSAMMTGTQDGNGDLVLHQQPDNTRFRYKVNNNTFVAHSTVSGLFLDTTRYGTGRNAAANQQLYFDGVQVDTFASDSTGLTALEIYLAGGNAAGSLISPIAIQLSYYDLINSPDIPAVNTELNLAQSLFNLN